VGDFAQNDASPDEVEASIAAHILNLDEILKRAEQEGYDRGVTAGSWLLDGNSTEEAARALLQETEDVVVLYAVGLTTEQGGLLRLHEPDRGLSTISDVPASLGRLRRNQLIEAECDGNAWRVRWGKRALDMALKAGVSIATGRSRWR
jgi:hypothetical protein